MYAAKRVAGDLNNPYASAHNDINQFIPIIANAYKSMSPGMSDADANKQAQGQAESLYKMASNPALTGLVSAMTGFRVNDLLTSQKSIEYSGSLLKMNALSERVDPGLMANLASDLSRGSTKMSNYGYNQADMAQIAQQLNARGLLDGMGSDLTKMDATQRASALERAGKNVDKYIPALAAVRQTMGITDTAEQLKTLNDVTGGGVVNGMSEGELETHMRKFDRIIKLTGITSKALTTFVQEAVKQAEATGADPTVAAKMALNMPVIAKLSTDAIGKEFGQIRGLDTSIDKVFDNQQQAVQSTYLSEMDRSMAVWQHALQSTPDGYKKLAEKDPEFAAALQRSRDGQATMADADLLRKKNRFEGNKQVSGASGVDEVILETTRHQNDTVGRIRNANDSYTVAMAHIPAAIEQDPTLQMILGKAVPELWNSSADKAAILMSALKLGGVGGKIDDAKLANFNKQWHSNIDATQATAIYDQAFRFNKDTHMLERAAFGEKSVQDDRREKIDIPVEIEASFDEALGMPNMAKRLAEAFDPKNSVLQGLAKMTGAIDITKERLRLIETPEFRAAFERTKSKDKAEAAGSAATLRKTLNLPNEVSLDGSFEDIKKNLITAVERGGHFLSSDPTITSELDALEKEAKTGKKHDDLVKSLSQKTGLDISQYGTAKEAREALHQYENDAIAAKKDGSDAAKEKFQDKWEKHTYQENDKHEKMTPEQIAKARIDKANAAMAKKVEEASTGNFSKETAHTTKDMEKDAKDLNDGFNKLAEIMSGERTIRIVSGDVSFQALMEANKRQGVGTNK